jgi:hypothetical protein
MGGRASTQKTNNAKGEKNKVSRKDWSKVSPTKEVDTEGMYGLLCNTLRCVY